MTLSDPELRAYVEKTEQMIAQGVVQNIAPEWHQVWVLLAAFDRFRLYDHDYSLNPSWRPRTQRMQEIIQHLIAPEHREALRAWYKNDQTKSGATHALRTQLSLIIGEAI